RPTQDSVVRRFEIIGEASNNLSEEIRQKSPDVNWPDVIGMRNNLIHEYFGIDIETIWDTIKNDLPVFRKQVTRLLEE
ncbi:MAG: HepT-like ribonuclease domain-containing protein, partial [Patescibacteria group bacterium]